MMLGGVARGGSYSSVLGQSVHIIRRPVAYTPSVCSNAVEEITLTIEVPIVFAEDIVGLAGANAAYIHHTSGAYFAVSENPDDVDKVTIEIKGTLSQVEKADQLLWESIEITRSFWGEFRTGPSSYSHLSGTYPSSSFASGPSGRVKT